MSNCSYFSSSFGAQAVSGPCCSCHLSSHHARWRRPHLNFFSLLTEKFLLVKVKWSSHLHARLQRKLLIGQSKIRNEDVSISCPKQEVEGWKRWRLSSVLPAVPHLSLVSSHFTSAVLPFKGIVWASCHALQAFMLPLLRLSPCTPRPLSNCHSFLSSVPSGLESSLCVFKLLPLATRGDNDV